ncbi:MAG: dTMP kinase [Rhodothermia bacterium]
MLVSFEGIDGSGKSTQITLLEARLLANGAKVLSLREPGGTQVSERVRGILLDPDLDISPVAELLLFSAARAQIVEQRIRPAMALGMTVLLDRFYDSTTAYQGAGRGVADPGWIGSLHRLATHGLIPDRTIWIDVPPEIARRRQDGQALDRMEIEDPGFYQRIHDCYVELVQNEPERFLRVDGTMTIDDIHDVIWSDVSNLRSAD